MFFSRLAKEHAAKLHIPPDKVRPIANGIAHVEHSGGALVGIEFLAPHVFGPVSLFSIGVGIIALRVWAGIEA